GILGRGEPVQQHRQPGTVGGRDPTAIDLDFAGGALIEQAQTLLPSLASGRERQGALDLQTRPGAGQHLDRGARAGGSGNDRGAQLLPPWTWVLPIAPGFSPFSRRAMMASSPSFSICGPKSSR